MSEGASSHIYPGILKQKYVMAQKKYVMVIIMLVNTYNG